MEAVRVSVYPLSPPLRPPTTDDGGRGWKELSCRGLNKSAIKSTQLLPRWMTEREAGITRRATCFPEGENRKWHVHLLPARRALAVDRKPRKGRADCDNKHSLMVNKSYQLCLVSSFACTWTFSYTTKEDVGAPSPASSAGRCAD